MIVFSVEPDAFAADHPYDQHRNPRRRPGRVARPKKRKTLTASQLKARGWTEGLTRSVLGEPDKRRKNPNHPSAALMRLYFMERVLDAEQQPSVRESLEHIAELRPKRSTTAKEAAARSRQKPQPESEPVSAHAADRDRLLARRSLSTPWKVDHEH